MTTKKIFQISEEESQILGYNVARGDTFTIENPELLREELKAQKIDVLKLSLENTKPDLYIQLNKLQIPYYVLGMVLELKLIFDAKPLNYLNKNIDFKEYKNENEIMFKGLVKEIFNDNAGSYYINPIFEIDNQKALQSECLAIYLSKQNSAFDDNKFTHLIFLDGKLAGFIVSYRKGSGGGVSYAGILKSFEKRGLFHDLICFIQIFGKSIGQKWGTIHSQIQNQSAIKMHTRMGMLPSGHVLNVHINACFGHLSGK